MTILLTVTVINGTSIYSNAQKTKLQSEISQIEVLVDNYITRNSGNNFESVTIDISGYTSSEKEQFTGENITNDTVKLYIIDLAAIDAEEVTYGTTKEGTRDRYLYSELTGRVYYDIGKKIGDTVYHRVDE